MSYVKDCPIYESKGVKRYNLIPIMTLRHDLHEMRCNGKFRRHIDMRYVNGI